MFKSYILPWMIHLSIAVGWFILTWQAKDRFWRHAKEGLLGSGQGRLLLTWLVGIILTPTAAWYWQLPHWGATIGSTILCGVAGTLYGDTRNI